MNQINGLIDARECERREPAYDLLHLNYMFDLTKYWIVDAHHVGNATRFANHDEKVNCVPNVVLLPNGEVRIGLYASRHIRKGEEILFNYGKNYNKHLN